MDGAIFEIFKQYTKRYVKLTDEELDRIESVCTYKKLRKQQYLLQEGDVWRLHAFIVRGCLRTYSIDDKGVEHIIELTIENWWAVDRESFLTLAPSRYNIDAWEDTELLVATVADMLDMIEKIPSFGQMTRLLDQRSFIVSQRRLNSTISNTAEKRYEEFADNHPQFIQRFPQHLIASFLGITKETLSRIRKQAIK